MNSLILLIDESSTGLDSLRGVLGDHAADFRLRRVPDVATALARIWGGGVNLVLMNLASAGGCATSAEQRLAPFVELRKRAAGTVIVVLCATGDEAMGEAAKREGAADFLIPQAGNADLLRIITSLLGKAIPSPPAMTATAKEGKILAVMGCKGGVGATTVALNLATSLARERRVILAELHTESGTLPYYFQPHRSTRSIADLLQADESVPGGLEACLWRYNNTPGLHILFGSRNAERLNQLSSGDAEGLLALAAESVEYVVADLPPSLGETNRAAIERCDFLVLVVERDSISVQAAKRMLQNIESWNGHGIATGVALVNRAALVSPLALSEIEAQLAVPILAVIPPAADLCAAAQNAHIPAVDLDPESLASIAFKNLASAITRQIPASRLVQPPSRGLPALRGAIQGLDHVEVR